MPELLVHPSFTSCLPKRPIVRALNLAEITKPIARSSDIDLDLFDNLRILWDDAPDQQLIRKLINSERTWEKADYYFLVQYRARRLENYDEEEEISTSAPNGHYKRDPIRTTFPLQGPDAPRPPSPTSRILKSRVKTPVPEIVLRSAFPNKRTNLGGAQSSTIECPRDTGRSNSTTLPTGY